MRRAELGKSQEAVALDSGILNQTTVSELEGGRYDIANLTAARLAGLARGLNWTLAEMEAALGVDFGLSGYASPTASSPRRGPPVRPPVEATEAPIDIPPGLLEAGEKYADIDPLIAHPRVQAMLARAGNFGGRGPQTAREWFKYFESVRDWIEVD
ncbi:XRE family transcriptional regulator [Deinococcus sp. DB0503]|nr:XRE family transcriptional regulator [Deinococcus sp. DB0503]